MGKLTVTLFDIINSTTNSVEEIDEKSFESDGVEWNTEAKAEGDVSAGVYIHLISKLYGVTGMDLSTGVVAAADGMVSVSAKPSSDGINFAGSLDLAIGPEISGKIVVEVPVIDMDLVEQPIFTITLPPWWEKHWESDIVAEESSGIENPKETPAGVPAMSELSNTYTTKLRGFTFNYSDNWEITREEVNTDKENVVLANDRGTRIEYQLLPLNSFRGSAFALAEVTKIAESKFKMSTIDESNDMDSSAFIVAKVHTNAVHSGGGGYSESFNQLAVLPESEIGERTLVGGYIDFEYGAYVSFVATSSNITDEFTLEEEKEIVSILASFREIEKSNEEVDVESIYNDLLKGNFSYFAGTYADGRGESFTILANGLLLDNSSSLTGTPTITANDEEAQLSWRYIMDANDETSPTFHIDAWMPGSTVSFIGDSFVTDRLCLAIGQAPPNGKDEFYYRTDAP